MGNNYDNFINSVISDINEFLSLFNLRCKLIEYNWSNQVGIYKYRSVSTGVMKVGVNLRIIEEFANEHDDTYFDIESIVEDQVLVTLWHEVGHGLMEHIRRVRRKDTQNMTGIFRGELLRDLRDIVYDEEDVVEEFGEYMADFGEESRLYRFLMKYKDIVRYRVN